MSADNGVYLGRFLRKDTPDGERGYEYRVIHAQAIENCDYAPNFPAEITDAYRVDYYGRADVCCTEKEAWEQARAMEKEIADSDFPILEYGVSEIHYDVPFPSMTAEEAGKKQDEYWGRREKEQEAEREKEVAVKCLVTEGMFSHEYFVMVQDYPSLTPVVWRGWVDKNTVQVDYSAGMTDEGYHFGVLHAYKVKEEVKTTDPCTGKEINPDEYGGGSVSSQLMYLIEFPVEGIGGRRVWVEPRMVKKQW